MESYIAEISAEDISVLIDKIIPYIICGSVAAIFALFDFHRAIVENGYGTAPISYTRSPAANFFFGMIAVLGMCLLYLAPPAQDGPVQSLIPVPTSNPWLYAACLGLLTPLIVRSKFAEVDGKKIGLEYAYDFFRAWSVGRYKILGENKKFDLAVGFASRIQNHQQFREDIVQMVRGSINHLSEEHREKFESDVRETISDADTVPDYKGTEYFIKLAVDHLNISGVRDFCLRYVS